MARPNKTQANKAQAIELYTTLQGNISAIASAIKVSRQQIYNWIKNDKKFKESIESISVDDLKLDLAEYQLQALIKKGYFPAIKFHLENKGSGRGYGDKKEIHVTGGLTVEAKPKVIFKKTDK